MRTRSNAMPASRTTFRHPAYIPYLYSVIALGAASLAYAACHLPQGPAGHRWIVLAALTVLASNFSIKIPTVNSKISIADTLYFTNTILFGPAAGIITAALDGLIGSLRARTRARRLQYICFNVAAMTVSALAGGLLFFQLLNREPLFYRPLQSVQEIIVPIGVLAFVHYLLNSGTVAVIVALEIRKNIYEIWHDSFLWTSITYFAGALAGAAISLTIGSITPQVLAIALPVLMAVYFTYRTYLDKVREVQSLAYYDSLTSLPNRVLFKERLGQALASRAGSEDGVAVMFLDLDNFKRINDTYGHCVGDLLVKGVASRLASSIPAQWSDYHPCLNQPDMVIGRFGGDEFTVLLTCAGNPHLPTEIAERLLHAFSTPFVLDGVEVTVAASIGIAVCPTDGTDADTLLKNADTAMFHAKGEGKSGYYFYSKSMNESSPQKLSLENELRKALARQEFEVYYQPKVAALTRGLTGAEALIRWHHPARGLLAAAEFIEMAEEIGLLKPIGTWVMHSVCAQIANWQKQGLFLVPVSINLSTSQFKQQNLLQTVSGALRDAGLEARYLHLELTEKTIMQNEEAADRCLRDLQELGLSISIDDFGTGYSSLSRLRRFSLDALKIDRSFVADLGTNPDDRALTRAIISMAASLRLKVVAEGVETERQLESLQSQGCDEIQGWLTGRPMPSVEFARLLESSSRPRPVIAPAVLFPGRAVASGERFILEQHEASLREATCRSLAPANNLCPFPVRKH